MSPADPPDIVEWVALDARTIVVATATSAWLHDPGAFAYQDPFAGDMQGPGSIASTARLLDGAIAAAQEGVHASARPPLTLARWIWRLAGLYHTTHATPPLMQEASERFEAEGRTALADYARAKVRDEGGHDRLALADLGALGLPAQRIVQALRPPTALALVEYFTDCVRGDDAVRALGYAYALERLASTVSLEYVREVETLLPPDVRATRCLRLHSSIGTDVTHVDDAVAVACGLTASERTRIVQACYRTACIIFSPPAGGHVSEDALVEAIAAAVPEGMPLALAMSSARATQ